MMFPVWKNTKESRTWNYNGQNHNLISLSVWFESSLIGIDSGFEEDFLSKNQNCIILETVHLETSPTPSLDDSCKTTDIFLCIS